MLPISAEKSKNIELKQSFAVKALMENIGRINFSESPQKKLFELIYVHYPKLNPLFTIRIKIKGLQ